MPKVNISCGEGESPHIIKDGMIDNGSDMNGFTRDGLRHTDRDIWLLNS